MDKNMTINYNKFNKILDQATEQIICGSDCQKMKKEETLKQKYLDAQNNLVTAPEQLENAKKNYYVYTQGEAGYNDMIEKELTERAENIGNILEEEFNTLVDKANQTNDTYKSDYISSKHVIELYNEYVHDNNILEKKVKDMTSETITNDRKTYYADQGITSLNDWYQLFRWIYFIFAIVVIIYLFVPSSNISIVKALVLTIIIILYPIMINRVLFFFLKLFNTTSKMMPKDVYLDKNY